MSYRSARIISIRLQHAIDTPEMGASNGPSDSAENEQRRQQGSGPTEDSGDI